MLRLHTYIKREGNYSFLSTQKIQDLAEYAKAVVWFREDNVRSKDAWKLVVELDHKVIEQWYSHG